MNYTDFITTTDINDDWGKLKRVDF